MKGKMVSAMKIAHWNEAMNVVVLSDKGNTIRYFVHDRDLDIDKCPDYLGYEVVVHVCDAFRHITTGVEVHTTTCPKETFDKAEGLGLRGYYQTMFVKAQNCFAHMVRVA